MVQLQIHRLAGTAAEHRQNTGRHGVQRTAVAQLAGAQHAAQLCHHVKAGPVHGLVYDQDAPIRVEPPTNRTLPSSEAVIPASFNAFCTWDRSFLDQVMC